GGRSRFDRRPTSYTSRSAAVARYARAMSSGGSSFFGEERFPNRMKHAIVGGYVPGALSLLIERYKTDAVYGDLCAGTALYGDGHPGSPLIVARHAAERLGQGKQHLIR